MKHQSSPPARHRSVIYVLPCKCPLLPPRHHFLDERPSQEASGAKDEAPNDDPVFIAVALKAHGGHVILLCIFADIDALPEAEGFRTVGT